MSTENCGGEYCGKREIADLQEKVRQLTSAAADAARATVTALDRLILANNVVESACAFIEDPHSCNAMFRLAEAVEAWEASRPS